MTVPFFRRDVLHWLERRGAVCAGLDDRGRRRLSGNRVLQKTLKQTQRAPEAPDVEMVAVTSDADAQAKRLIGSPTIRIDGVDIEGPDADTQGYALGCRVYSDEGRMAGWPSVTRIRQALKGARKNSEGERT